MRRTTVEPEYNANDVAIKDRTYRPNAGRERVIAFWEDVRRYILRYRTFMKRWPVGLSRAGAVWGRALNRGVAYQVGRYQWRQP